MYYKNINNKNTNERMQKSMNNKSGITLVALIITIIVLLILATVSISLVINNNVLDKAQHGVDKYSEQEVKEKVELIIANYKLDIGNNKNFIEYLEEEKNNNEIEEYIENDDNTVTVRLNNYDIIVKLEDITIIDLYYNTQELIKTRIVGEIYTTSTNNMGACVKVISYSDNEEKEFNHYTAIANSQEFSDFSVSYVQSEFKWHVKGKMKYMAYSTKNSTDLMQYVDSNDLSWRYTQVIHYYIIACSQNGTN